MAVSVRESALQALFAALGAVTGAPDVVRNAAVPQSIGSAGLIILRDGDPGKPDEMMSPAQDSWEHRTDVEVYVQTGDPADRATAIDAIGVGIAAALNADRTLGGKVQSVYWGPPVLVNTGVDGAPAIEHGVISVYLYYETPAGGLE